MCIFLLSLSCCCIVEVRHLSLCGYSPILSMHIHVENFTFVELRTSKGSLKCQLPPAPSHEGHWGERDSLPHASLASGGGWISDISDHI